MKKIYFTILLIILILCFPLNISANMAAPDSNDLATQITFQKNDDLVVTSEIIDIHFKETIANIDVKYKMKNINNSQVTTPSMFISPNIDGEAITIYANDKKLDYTAKEYYASYEYLNTNDWQYVILEPEHSNSLEVSVNTITFNLNFEPLEEYEVRVNYNYRLGGRANRDDDLKYATLEYFLTPAAMWKDFKNLEINLYLDESLPKLDYSSLKFENLGDRHYQYKANELPTENLNITLNQSGWQEFWSSFKNPYNYFYLIFYLPIILLAIIIIAIGVIIYKKRKKTTKNI